MILMYLASPETYVALLSCSAMMMMMMETETVRRSPYGSDKESLSPTALLPSLPPTLRIYPSETLG